MTYNRSLFQTYYKSNTLPLFETAGKSVCPIGFWNSDYLYRKFNRQYNSIYLVECLSFTNVAN